MTSIALSDGKDFCVKQGSIESLRKCKTFSARLVGPGINQVKKFALIEFRGDVYIADTVTGSLFECDGSHHTSQQLKVVDIPKVHPSEVPKWLRLADSYVSEAHRPKC